ncbi:MAG: OsmC family protein [Propionibacteriaceae bacterium]|nr:OsmC family protein [Propionibacteriaceae bacterium]
MTKNKAQAHWEGPLLSGKGQVTLASSQVASFPIGWAARAESVVGTTNPEELIAAAHAACYSMALSNGLANNGTPPARLDTTVEVGFDPRTGLTGSHISVVGAVPGIDADQFQHFAEDAKANCPVSKALAGIPITLDAQFEQA